MSKKTIRQRQKSRNALFLMKGVEMKKNFSNDEEVKIYHLMCDISKICRKYFYSRNHLPSDFWSVDEIVNKMLLKCKDLNTLYNNVGTVIEDE